MFKVVIAEDEMLVRMGLSVSVEWEKLNLNLVAEVRDGNEAYYAFLKHRPDIILTDIRMPGMDGLTLIQKIREVDTTCQIIVISCMTDFATLHEAMSYNISSYLIKATMTQDDIRQALETAVSKLTTASPAAAVEESDQARLMNNALTDYIVLRSRTWKQLTAFLQENELDVPPPSGVLTVYWPGGVTESLILKTVSRMISGAISAQQEDRYFICENSLVFMTDAFLGDGWKRNLHVLNETYSYINENFSRQLRFVCSTGKISLQELPGYLERARELSQRAYLFATPTLAADEQGKVADRDVLSWFDMLRANAAALRLDPALYDDYISAVESAQKSLGQPRREVLKEFYSVTTLLAQGVKYITPELLTRCHEYLAQATSLQSMMSIIDKQLLALAGTPSSAYTSLLATAIEYIVAHLESEITLNAVAAHISLSPGYFSTLLKNETGMRFAEFLSDLRLRRAQELLKNNELTINDIAQRCGYSDIAYFSRCFKNRFGVSPSRWRKS